MGRASATVALLALVITGAAAISSSSRQLPISDSTDQRSWDDLCERLEGLPPHRADASAETSDASVRYSVAYQLAGCRSGVPAWTARLRITDCDGECDAQALASEVESLTFAFDQEGLGYSHLRTTKHGRVAPPLSEAARAVAASAARTVAALHFTEADSEPRALQRRLLAVATSVTVTAVPKVLVCGAATTADLQIKVVLSPDLDKVAPALAATKDSATIAPICPSALDPADNTNMTYIFNCTGLGVGAYNFNFTANATFSGDANVTIAAHEITAVAPPTAIVAKSADLPAKVNLTVHTTHTNVTVPSNCAQKTANGMDLSYECLLNQTTSLTFALGACPAASVSVSVGVDVKDYGIQVADRIDATAPICDPSKDKATLLVPVKVIGADLTQENVTVHTVEDGAVNPCSNTTTWDDATKTATFTCIVGVGTMGIRFKASRDGITVSNMTTLNVTSYDYSLAVAPRTIKLLPPPPVNSTTNATDVLIKVMAGRGVNHTEVMPNVTACAYNSTEEGEDDMQVFVFNCSGFNVAPTETIVQFDATGAASQCAATAATRMAVGIDRGFSLTVDPAFNPAINLCLIDDVRNAIINVTVAGDGLNATTDFTPSVVSEREGAACVLSAYTAGVATYNCTGIRRGSTNITWSVEKEFNIAEASVKIRAKELNHSVEATALTPAIVVTGDSKGEIGVEVLISEGLTKADIATNVSACAFAKEDGLSLLYNCSALAPGKYLAEFSTNKSGCPARDIARFDVISGSSTDAVPVVDPCASCTTCLKDAQSFVAEITPSTTAASAASLFKDRCMSSDRSDATCIKVSIDIGASLNGNLARRPAALCYAMGECVKSLGCTGSIKNGTEANATVITGALDACTATGLVGGAAAPAQTPVQAGACVSDDDCSVAKTNLTDQLCEINTASAPVCTCKDGVDVCVKQGTCVAYCSQSMQTATLAKAADKMKPCNATADCAVGNECVDYPGCFVLTCANSSITEGPCNTTGICLPATRTGATAAAFDPTHRTIAVTLASAAKPGIFACADIFDANTTLSLGAGALCSVNVAAPTALKIQLPPSATILVGGSLVTKAQTVLVGDPAGAAFNFTLSVADCAVGTCLAPVAILLAPSVISKPCSAAQGLDVVLDASQSFDPSGRPLKSIQWSFEGTSVNTSAAILALMTAVNARTGGARNQSRLLIPNATLFDLAPGSYKIQAAVQSAFNLGSNPVATIEVKAAGKAPVISIVGPTVDRPFRPIHGFKITSTLLPESVCASTMVNYAWAGFLADGTTAWDDVPVSTQKTLVVPGPIAVPAGQSRKVVLTASIVGQAANAAVQEVGLLAEASPLVAKIKGPTDHRATATIVISAADSFDPDDATVPLNFAFTCARDDGRPCFAGARGNIFGPTWTIPPGLLTADVAHTFTVTISKTADSRTATASLKGVRPRPVEVPTGVLTRVCGAAACSATQSGSAPLTVALRLPAAASGATIAWTVNGATIADATGKVLTVPAASLPTDGSPVTVAAQITLGGQTGVAALTVPINVAPVCTVAADAGGCLSVEAKSTAFPDAEFAAAAEGFADEGELMYEWGVVDGVTGRHRPLLIDRANSFRFRGLTVGPHVLYVRAIDASGAAAEATKSVIVDAPAAGFNATASAEAFNIAAVAATMDPTVINAAARSLAAIAGVGANSSAAALQAAIDTKGATVLASIASVVNQWDPEGAETAVTSAADLVAAMSNVSSDAKADAIDLGDKLLLSAQLADKPIPPAAASAAIRLFKTGAPRAPLPNEVSRAQSSVNITAQRDAVALMRGLTDRLQDVAASLVLGADPSDTYLPAGAAGVHVSVASHPAGALANSAIAVGPNANGAAATASDASVAFAGPLVGPCSTVNDSGIEVEEPCAIAPVTVAAEYHQDATLFTNIRKDAGLPLIYSTDTTDPTVVSGAVSVSVSGQAPDDTLPCDPAADASTCTIAITLPLIAPAAAPATTGRRLLVDSATLDLTCVRVEGQTTTNPVLRPQAADGLYSITASNANTATCTTRLGGTYMIVGTPKAVVPVVDPIAAQAGETVYTAPEGTRPYGFTMRFVGMDYAAVIANSTLRAAFRADLRAAVAAKVAAVARADFAPANVQIGPLTEGSVIAEVTLHAPATWTPDQVNAAATSILTDPRAIFSETFLATYGITGVEATLAPGTALPPGPKAGLTPGAQAGIAIGVIVAVLSAAAGGYVAWKKKQQGAAGGRGQAVFDNLPGAEAGAGGYVPPAAGAAR